MVERRPRQRPPGHRDDSRARLAAIVESSDDAIVSKDLNGVITTWNAGAERIFGYTAAEAIGRPVTMLMPPERHDEEPGILERVRRGERIEHYETVRRRKDGTLLDISLTVSPIVDADGRIIGASKIARDVSDRKQAAARLALDQEATTRLYDIGQRCLRAGDHVVDTLTEVLATAMWMADARRGALQLYDERASALTPVVHHGLPPELVAFFSAVEHGDAAACGTALAARERVIVEDVSASAIFAGQRSAQVLRDAGIRAIQSTPLLSSGDAVLGMLSTFWDEPHRPTPHQCQLLDLLARQAADYLERKRSEAQREDLLRIAQQARREAEAANRAKDEFLAMLGHELRNPLAAVRNAIAAAVLDEASRARALEIARRQTDQLGRIVDDLLDVARIDRGRIRLRKTRVRLRDVVARSVDAGRALMEERGHTVVLALPVDEVALDADPTRVEQALGNLLSNAAKYTEPGGRIEVSAAREDDEAVIRVRDNGVGIAPEVLPTVFDLFAQAKRTLDRSEGGLGIGLTLVRRIVQMHGGTVTAASAGRGTGAEFTIRLPALPAEEGRMADAPTTAEARRPVQDRRARVLMVEDNPDAAESLLMILELLGHHVRVVHDGVAALTAARANVPDLMLVDIGLPGMNGYEVARAVRRDPALAGIVLVALTGYGRSEDKAEALAAGFDYHLVKPVDLDALGSLVARLGSGDRGEPTVH